MSVIIIPYLTILYFRKKFIQLQSMKNTIKPLFSFRLGLSILDHGVDITILLMLARVHSQRSDCLFKFEWPRKNHLTSKIGTSVLVRGEGVVTGYIGRLKEKGGALLGLDICYLCSR